MRFRALTGRTAGCCIERIKLLVLACLIAACPILAVSAADAIADNLSRLEQKFFQHDYPKDDKDARIERLEKLVFGEAKTGSDDARLQSLLALVPNLSPKSDETESTASQPQMTPDEPRKASNDYPPPRNDQGYNKPAENPVAKNDSDQINNVSSYPAVTAIEKKLLGRDYIGEPINQRLNRLETKAFGKTMASEDLQDRVDKLKASSGVDVAKVAPAGSDWADEEDDQIVQQPDLQPFTGVGGSRDYRRDAQNSVTRQPRSSSGYQDEYSGTGTFGAGGIPRSAPSPVSSDRIASAGGMPPMAPNVVRGGGMTPAPAPAKLGMNQQLAVLEREVFHKTYNNDTIPERLNRLESTVFPQDKVAANKSLPDRLSRLVAAVPVSESASPVAARPKTRRGDPDFAELDDMDMADGIPVAPARGQGGLSKIMNGLGNMLGGGGTYTTGGYPSAGPGTLVTDPSTGMLYDQYTGTLIDPMTGAVVGRRAPLTQQMYNGYGGFNSGFAPASPYGMGGMSGSGMGFGLGSSGLRFGSGMWP